MITSHVVFFVILFVDVTSSISWLFVDIYKNIGMKDAKSLNPK